MSYIYVSSETPVKMKMPFTVLNFMINLSFFKLRLPKCFIMNAMRVTLSDKRSIIEGNIGFHSDSE